MVGGTPFFGDLEGSQTSLKRLLRRKETVYENIKDLDFEYKMGKLSDEDYQGLRSDYEQQAFRLMPPGDIHSAGRRSTRIPSWTREGFRGF